MERPQRAQHTQGSPRSLLDDWSVWGQGRAGDESQNTGRGGAGLPNCLDFPSTVSEPLKGPEQRSTFQI